MELTPDNAWTRASVEAARNAELTRVTEYMASTAGPGVVVARVAEPDTSAAAAAAKPAPSDMLAYARELAAIRARRARADEEFGKLIGCIRVTRVCVGAILRESASADTSPDRVGGPRAGMRDAREGIQRHMEELLALVEQQRKFGVTFCNGQNPYEDDAEVISSLQNSYDATGHLMDVIQHNPNWKNPSGGPDYNVVDLFSELLAFIASAENARATWNSVPRE